MEQILPAVDPDRVTGIALETGRSPKHLLVRVLWHSKERKMILNKSQAEAVYSAMCALNNVSARLDVNLPQGNGLAIRVYEGLGGRIFLTTERGQTEIYADQSAFATAYDLQQG